MYGVGEGVEKDEEKFSCFGGHPNARHNLAAIEEGNGNMDRAMKHGIIAANLEYEESMKTLWVAFKNGYGITNMT